MPTSAEQLRAIKTFPSLVKYLRDELDWPIESDKFDDLTFEYQPEELGLDAKTAVKIKEIKQLRPLVRNQPWGIFFINFEPKNLPVIALRRILSHLVIKKRKSANTAERPAWAPHDLLFISSYGETDHRDITFAQFSEDGNAQGDLPSLRVLSWDDENTAAHLEHAHQTLKDKLHWPADPSNLDSWRTTWSTAFTLKPREVVNTSKALAIRMAELATTIRKRVNKILEVESDRGPLRKLHASFKEALIHDLEPDDFADMYAQTITYGLLSARISRPAGLVAENIADMVPVTNPFLRDLLSTFLTIGGRKGKIDFDEVGINEVVQVLRDANMEAVLRDFGDRNPQEDPVVHFYELFLKEYDPKKRMQRGVFYTPRPVVFYIVRSVDEILRKEFGLADGLADTATWGQMVKRHSEIKIPEGAKADDAFVQILDPATGTGTFLVEVIDVIHKTMVAKWTGNRLVKGEIRQKWNEYVSDHLLPRLYGFELMMAPYAVAHMKIGLKLHDTGYDFKSHERARIYLTNSLEPAHGFSGQLELDAPALAHEAQAVNEVKAHKRFTVVIGNPPYAAFSCNPSIDETGKLTVIGALIEEYKFIGGKPVEEKKWWLQDDYVKFIRLTEWIITLAGTGIAGLITNHSYLDNPTFRGMRWHILQSFNGLFVLNLHGNAKTAGKAAEVAQDQNVFDIQQGVAVVVAVSRHPQTTITRIQYADVHGPRTRKYKMLSEQSISSSPWNVLAPRPPSFLLVPQNIDCETEYFEFVPLADVFLVKSVGFVTARDALTIADTEEEIWARVRKFLELPLESARIEFDLGKDARDWKIEYAQKDLRVSGPSKDKIFPVCYRPFDTRFTYYSGQSRGFIGQPQRKVMNHLIGGNNLALVTTRQQSVVGDWSLIGVSNRITESSYLSNKTAEINYVFPLKLIAENEGMQGAFDLAGERTNLNLDFTTKLQKKLGQHVHLTSEDIFHYIYGVFHSPGYRSRYAEFLKFEFPRLPLTANLELFRALASLGGELVSLHLLESPKLDKTITKWRGRAPSSEVEKITYSDETIWTDKAKTEGFHGVPEPAWNFHIGGYQVCQKWLKDRKGRQLSKDDIAHYQKIVVALNETIRLMKAIDEVIEKHGGWPGAFAVKKGQTDGFH